MRLVDNPQKHRLGWLLWLLLMIGVIGLAGCAGEGYNGQHPEEPVVLEPDTGLILEGEGPIPGRLIAVSKNSLSDVEDQVVLQEIAQELDRLVELAGQLDEAVSGEATTTGDFTQPGDAGIQDEGEEDAS